jgi:hypothetical protein
LRLKGLTVEIEHRVNGVTVPLVVQVPGNPLWIDIHHPFVDPEQQLSNVEKAARASFQEVVALDAHTLIHDLPSAVARLQIPDGVVQ